MTSFLFHTEYTLPSITLDLGTVETHNKSGTAISCAISDSGGSEIKISKYLWGGVSDPGVETSGTVWSTPYDQILPTGDGAHYLWVWVQDNAGNEHVSSFLFYTDDTPPSITLDLGTVETHYKSGTAVSCVISDSGGSGLKESKYLWGRSTTDPGVKTDGSPWSSPYDQFLPAGNGTHYLWVWVQDNLGNEQVAGFLFYTDDSAPETTTTSSTTAKTTMTTSTGSSTPSLSYLLVLFVFLAVITVRRQKRRT